MADKSSSIDLPIVSFNSFINHGFDNDLLNGLDSITEEYSLTPNFIPDVYQSSQTTSEAEATYSTSPPLQEALITIDPRLLTISDGLPHQENAPPPTIDPRLLTISGYTDFFQLSLYAPQLSEADAANLVDSYQPAFKRIVIPPPPLHRAGVTSEHLDIGTVVENTRDWPWLIHKALVNFSGLIYREHWFRNEAKRLEDARQIIYELGDYHRSVIRKPLWEPEFDLIHPTKGHHMVMGVIEEPHLTIVEYVASPWRNTRRNLRDTIKRHILHRIMDGEYGPLDSLMNGNGLHYPSVFTTMRPFSGRLMADVMSLILGGGEAMGFFKGLCVKTPRLPIYTTIIGTTFSLWLIHLATVNGSAPFDDKFREKFNQQLSYFLSRMKEPNWLMEFSHSEDHWIYITNAYKRPSSA